MNFLRIVVLCVAVAVASAAPGLISPLGAGLIGPAVGGAILEGPAAKTIIAGPDGSLITAAGQAGALVAGTNSAGILTSGIAPGIIAGPAISSGIITTRTIGPIGTIAGNGIPLNLGLSTGVAHGIATIGAPLIRSPLLATTAIGGVPILRTGIIGAPGLTTIGGSSLISNGAIISRGSIISGNGLLTKTVW